MDTTQTTLTTNLIHTIHTEAGQAGDSEMVHHCEVLLGWAPGDADLAREAVRELLSDAAAQQDTE
jgi:hypothetical protein